MWQIATLVFFGYLGLIAAAFPRVPARYRRRTGMGAAVGVLAAAGSLLAPNSIVDVWILPPLMLLLGYWTSGLLFVSPMPRAERALLHVDHRLGVSRIAAALPRAAAELLEGAYMAVYAVVPLALVMHLTRTPTPDPDRFWTVILATDYICFATMPFIQTRPPRALEANQPWASRFRPLNLRLLGRASIHANTFPSGHAAEALAAALLVNGAGAIEFGVMCLMALAISAGAVCGRYHYAVDAVLGWVVALAVWWAV